LAMGALMRNSGRLYAFDVSEKRLQNLGVRLKRSGLSNLHAQVITSEADPKLKRLNAKFDRVLVDAPCSGLGTLRRNPDLKWRQTPQDIIELTAKQTRILDRAAKLVKAGGRLIYATCSLLQEENEQIADAFLASHPDYTLVNANQILVQQKIDLDTGVYLKLLPHLHQTDGFFAAVFEKVAAVVEKKKPEAALAAKTETPVVVEEQPVPEPAKLKRAAVKKAPAAKKTAATKADVTDDVVAVEAEPKAVKAKTVKPKVAKAKVVESAAEVKPKIAKPKVVKTKAASKKADTEADE